MLELAESRAEESILEDNKIWKSLHQQCNCNEDFSCASVKQQRKSTSHYDSFEPYIGISSGRNANEEKHNLSTAAVMSNDAVISFPESVIVKLLQASGATTDSMFRNTLATKPISDIIEDKMQQNIRTEPVNYVLVIFINHNVQFKSSEEHAMHYGIYSGIFSSSALIEDEVVFVPCIEVQLAVLLDFFRHLPKPFSCVIEDIGLHKICCIRDHHHNSRFLGNELKRSHRAGGDIEKPNSMFNAENITILQVPGVLLPCCLELATASNSSSQKHFSMSSFIHGDKGMLSPADGSSKKQVSDTCVTCKAVVANNFKTSSDTSCFTLGSSSGFVQDLSLCSKEECRGEPQCPECTLPCDASKAFAESKQVTGEGMEENLDGRFTFEHCNDLLLDEGDKGRRSVQWTDRQKLESDGGNICMCTSKSVLDIDWSEEAEQWCSDGTSSSGATQENIAQRILVELRSLSHSLLDVFDIIQRTPPLTKRTFLLPRELLCQHKVLHASTSSLESCPLAQSECFRLNDDGVSCTKKRRKKKKKTTV